MVRFGCKVSILIFDFLFGFLKATLVLGQGLGFSFSSVPLQGFHSDFRFFDRVFEGCIGFSSGFRFFYVRLAPLQSFHAHFWFFLRFFGPSLVLAQGFGFSVGLP